MEIDHIFIVAMSEWNGRAVDSTSVAPNDLEHALKYVTSPQEHPVYYNCVVCWTFWEEILVYRYRLVGVVTRRWTRGSISDWGLRASQEHPDGVYGCPNFPESVCQGFFTVV